MKVSANKTNITNNVTVVGLCMLKGGREQDFCKGKGAQTSSGQTGKINTFLKSLYCICAVGGGME